MSDHTRKVLKTCSTCGDEFATVRELIIHEMQHRKSKDDEQLKLTSATSTTKGSDSVSASSSSFARNTTTHGHPTSSPYMSADVARSEKDVCKFCFGSFASKKSMYPHHRTCHFIDVGRPLYYCSQCGNRSGPFNRDYFRKSKDFRQHMKTSHGIDRSPPHYDSDSSEDDSNSSKNDVSMVTTQEIVDRIFRQSRLSEERHLDGTYVCEYCFQQFKALVTMLSHIEKMHRANDHLHYYYCFRCSVDQNRHDSKSFQNDAAFWRHLIDAHGLTAKSIEKNIKNGTHKLVRSDLSNVVKRRRHSNADCDSRLDDDSESSDDDSVGDDTKAPSMNAADTVVKEEIDGDSSESHTISKVDRGSPSTSVGSAIVNSRKRPLDIGIDVNARAVKKELIDGTVSVDSGRHRDRNNLELGTVKEEPTNDGEQENGEEQAQLAICVVVKTELEDTKTELGD